ncbi:MAG: N-terminal phage integrase SAM-like domain-containing protein, partial [Christensenellales bacterium]
MKYKDWLYEWLENYVKTGSKERTYERYSQMCSLHIIPALGEYDLTDISVMVLQKHITSLLTDGNWKTGKGLSANFVNTVISVIQNSLKTANMVGIATEYTANKIKR